jgi:hypothetical protein
MRLEVGYWGNVLRERWVLRKDEKDTNRQRHQSKGTSQIKYIEKREDNLGKRCFSQSKLLILHV